MPRECFAQLARRRVPQTNCVVLPTAAAHQSRAIRVERNAPNIGSMPLERSAGFSRGGIPQADGSVRTPPASVPPSGLNTTLLTQVSRSIG